MSADRIGSSDSNRLEVTSSECDVTKIDDVKSNGLSLFHGLSLFYGLTVPDVVESSSLYLPRYWLYLHTMVHHLILPSPPL